MLLGLRSYLLYGNLFCGIEHTRNSGNNIVYVTLLKKSKKEIEVESSFESETIEKLSIKLQKKQHAFLIINDGNVFTKRIESPQTDDLKLVYMAFPNINVEDIFYEIIRQGPTYFVAICRKDHVDDLISKYQSSGISVNNVSFGNSLISSVSAFMDKDNIMTSNAVIQMKDNDILSIEGKEYDKAENYDVNGLRTTSKGLLSLSGALTAVIDNYAPQTNFEHQRQLLVNDFKQTRFFTQFLKFGLVFLFGLLMVNFLFFSHYYGKVNTLQQTSQVNQITKKQVLELNAEVDKKQKMVDDMLKSGTSKSSFYTNAIVQSLPKTILLAGLNYQPLLKQIKEGQLISIDTNVLLISGESSNSNLFSAWISDLDKNAWVSKVDILDYNDVSNSSSNFSIKLNITNEQ